MTRQQGTRPRHFAAPSRKCLLVASLAGVIMSVNPMPAYAQAGLDNLDFTALFDPLEGAILSTDYQNVRVPEVPDAFCSQQEKDALSKSLLAVRAEAEANVERALLTQQFLKSEIPGLEEGMQAARENADHAANTGIAAELTRALKQIKLYEQAMTKLYASIGQAEAEEIRFNVTIDRIDSQHESLEATKIVNCAQEKLSALGAARQDAPQFSGANINTSLQSKWSLSLKARYTGDEAKNALDKTMKNLVLPIPNNTKKEKPVRVGLKPYQGVGAKLTLSPGARFKKDRIPSPAALNDAAKETPKAEEQIPCRQADADPGPRKRGRRK